MWLEASLGVHEQSGYFRLTLNEWNPGWLDSSGAMLTKPLFAEEHRRTYDDVKGDPFLSAAALDRYRCDAQREAIRTILSVPDGSTVIVNLPTGAGKSLCAHLPALLTSQRGGVSIVIVPTTSLALDQERSIRTLVPHDTAYVGGDTIDERDRRAGIGARVRDGSQRIVFTSPESLLRSLRPAVYDAARRGFLRFLVIDEAHIVEQWGDEFRSSFQEVAGIRRDLRRQVSPESPTFSTLLLTATLTDTAFDTLQTLFGDNQSVVTVSAAQLRPEPSYWAMRMPNEDERTAAVLDSIRHLPRPLMLYVTEPIEAAHWMTVLRASGYSRMDTVTGLTPNNERAKVIERWRNAETDIVVATSAFGLGVDQADVRAVIHATVPENVDRFYQEVGRGGRDGRASASIVLYTQEDLQRAKSMNRKKIIGIKRGRERWTQMFEMREDLGNDRIRVPIDVRPNLADGVDMDNDMNQAWNIRTLTLMSRAGLLSFDAEAPPPFSSDSSSDLTEVETAHQYAEALTEQQRHRVVSVNHHGTIAKSVWEEMVEPARRVTSVADLRSHKLMLELLEGNRCTSQIFQDAYSISEEKGGICRPEVSVAIACGGCAYCRLNGHLPYATPLPTTFPNYPTRWKVGASLEKACSGGSAIAIFYPKKPDARQLSRIFRWLIGQGVQLIVAPPDTLDQVAEALYQQNANHPSVFTYVIDGFRFMQAPALPALLFLPPGAVLSQALQNSFSNATTGTPLKILLAASDTPDAIRTSRPLISTLQCRTYRLEEFVERIGL
jgi:superfamily II DNA helicase RecQ